MKMPPLGLGTAIAAWREANALSQRNLAHLLGVLPEAVARWENGTDAPSAANSLRLRDIMSPLARNSFMQRQTDLEMRSDLAILADLDGTKLLAVSKGVQLLWPEFSTFVGRYLHDHLVSTARTLLHDDQTVHAVRRGEIAILTGVSEEHVALGGDQRMRHHWSCTVRPYGSRMVLEMSFRPCDPTEDLGIKFVAPVQDL